MTTNKNKKENGDGMKSWTIDRIKSIWSPCRGTKETPEFLRRIENIKRLAAGHEIEIVRDVARVPGDLLDGKIHRCPKCKCAESFRLTDPEKGAVYCDYCTSDDNDENGDFITAVLWRNSWDFLKTLDLIEQYLNGKDSVLYEQ